MDWTKAKTILIVALIGTNIFLVFTFGFNGFAQKSGEIKDVLIPVLANNNITLATEIPPKQGKYPVLYLEYKAFDQGKINDLIKANGYVATSKKISEEDLVKLSDLFLSDSGLLNEHVIFASVHKQGAGMVVAYKNEINGMAIEESYIYCYFEKGELLSVDSYWLEAKSLSKKKMNVITPEEALIGFMTQVKNKEEKIVVESMELVYWLDTSTFDGEEFVTDTALPAWKIVYNGNQNKHIYAYEE